MIPADYTADPDRPDPTNTKSVYLRPPDQLVRLELVQPPALVGDLVRSPFFGLGDFGAALPGVISTVRVEIEIAGARGYERHQVHLSHNGTVSAYLPLGGAHRVVVAIFQARGLGRVGTPPRPGQWTPATSRVAGIHQVGQKGPLLTAPPAAAAKGPRPRSAGV